MDTEEGENDLFGHRDRAGKDVQQVGSLTNEESMLRRWEEHCEELMNEENEREPRMKELETGDEEGWRRKQLG